MAGLFGKTPQIPKPRPTPRMPTPTDDTNLEARRLQRQMAQQRTGRRSTVLTADLQDRTGSSGKLGTA